MTKLDTVGFYASGVAFVCGFITALLGVIHGKFDEASYGLNMCILMFLFYRFHYQEKMR